MVRVECRNNLSSCCSFSRRIGGICPLTCLTVLGKVWVARLPPPLHSQGSVQGPCSHRHSDIDQINQLAPISPPPLLYIQNEQVKGKCLSKQNSVWLSPSMGKFPWMCQSLGCKIAPPTCNPHFPMTWACQSLTKSKPNFMPSKDQFVNHFACHTSTSITWQLQLLLSNAVGLVKLLCLS